MRIVIAPQGFKGTLSGIEAASAMAEGVRRVAPDAEVVLRPVADGGHGTLDTLLEATGGTAYSAQVTGPMGRQVDARWGLLGDGATVVVEMAQASGLTLVPEAMRDPMIATTYGTGQLIETALAAGHRRLLIGVGGSATSDGGAGAAQALGVRLLDAQGHDIPFGAAGLLQLANIDLSTLNPLAADSRFQVATDVSHPLCGPHGAAMVYGPQKGAQPAQLPLLDAALSRLADVVQQEIGADIRDLPGAGAAGGLAAGLVAFLGAELAWGIELVCDAIHFDDTLQGARLVLTGEGRLGRPDRVTKGAHRRRAPGQDPTPSGARRRGLTRTRLPRSAHQGHRPGGSGQSRGKRPTRDCRRSLAAPCRRHRACHAPRPGRRARGPQPLIENMSVYPGAGWVDKTTFCVWRSVHWSA